MDEQSPVELFRGSVNFPGTVHKCNSFPTTKRVAQRFDSPDAKSIDGDPLEAPEFHKVCYVVLYNELMLVFYIDSSLITCYVYLY